MNEAITSALSSKKPGLPDPKNLAAAWVKQAVGRIENPSGCRGGDLYFVRGTIKRLRSMLRMIRPVIGETLFHLENQRLRSAAHALGGSRDRVVERATLEALSKLVKYKSEKKAFKRVLELYRAVDRHREPEEDRMENAMRAVARALRLSGARILRLPAAPEEWRTIGPGFERTYRSGRRRMKEAFKDGADSAFHRWRIRVRNLSDQLEYLAPYRSKAMRRAAFLLKKLRGKLGDCHDLAILENALVGMPVESKDSLALECVLERLHQRKRKLRSASRELGETIFRERPARFVQRLKKHWRNSREAAKCR